MTYDVDVIVIGAGVAGLIAADRLVAAGWRVRCWRRATGWAGRTLTVPVPGYQGISVDQGGQWVGPSQDPLYRELARFGLATHPQSTGGSALVLFRGKARRYTRRIPRLDPLTLLEVGRAQLRSDRLARSVDLDQPVADAARPGTGRADLRKLAAARLLDRAWP